MWDVSCERPIRRDRQEYGDSNSKKNSSGKKFEKNKKVDPWLQPENGPLTIKQLLYEFPTCPPDAYVYLKEYIYIDNVNFILSNDKYAQHDVNIWCGKLTH